MKMVQMTVFPLLAVLTACASPESKIGLHQKGSANFGVLNAHRAAVSRRPFIKVRDTWQVGDPLLIVVTLQDPAAYLTKGATFRTFGGTHLNEGELIDTIAVTITGVMPNGDILFVEGNGNDNEVSKESTRFKGIVNPVFITRPNKVNWRYVNHSRMTNIEFVNSISLTDKQSD